MVARPGGDHRRAGRARLAGARWLAAHPHVGGWLVGPPEGRAGRDGPRRRRGGGRPRRARAACAARATTCSGSAWRSRPSATSSRLQQTIVRSARRLTHADSGSLYLLEDGPGGERVLRFAVAQTGPDDAGTHLGAVLPLSRTSISGYVALTGETVRIDDAYDIPPDAEYRFNPQLRPRQRLPDEVGRWRCRCATTRTPSSACIMLINRKPEFDTRADLARPHRRGRARRSPRATSAAALAGLASRRRAGEQSAARLDPGPVRTVRARVGQGDRGARQVDRRATPRASPTSPCCKPRRSTRSQPAPFAELHFDADQLREMRYASLLHDFGKVAVPEYIFGKAKKLPDGRIDAIRLRFLLAIEQCADERRRARAARAARAGRGRQRAARRRGGDRRRARRAGAR